MTDSNSSTVIVPYTYLVEYYEKCLSKYMLGLKINPRSEEYILAIVKADSDIPQHRIKWGKKIS